MGSQKEQKGGVNVDITKELMQFQITDTAIAELKDRYMGLKIKGLDDKEGFELVHRARIDVKNRRVEVTKTGKSLRAEANAYNQAVLKEEKRILCLLEPIEEHLEAEERRVTEEKERIKAEALEAEKRRITARVDALFALGMTFNGIGYNYLCVSITQDMMIKATDEQFGNFCTRIAEAKEEEEKRLAEIEKTRKEEEVRISKIAEEQAEEKKRLDAVAKEQADKEAKIKAEEDRIAAEKKAVEDAKIKEEDDRRRAEELEKAKAEAAEKAKAEEIRRREEEERKRAEREAKAEAARVRKEARRPDREKLMALADTIDAIPLPVLKTEEAQEMMVDIASNISQLTDNLRKKAEAL
jgi:hypothetical protein